MATSSSSSWWQLSAAPPPPHHHHRRRDAYNNQGKKQSAPPTTNENTTTTTITRSEDGDDKPKFRNPHKKRKLNVRANSTSFIGILCAAILLATWKNIDLLTRAMREQVDMTTGDAMIPDVHQHHYHQGSSASFLLFSATTRTTTPGGGRCCGVVRPPSSLQYDVMPNFSGLKIRPTTTIDNYARSIAENDNELYNKMRSNQLLRMDKKRKNEYSDEVELHRYDPFDEQQQTSSSGNNDDDDDDDHDHHEDGCYRLKYASSGLQGSCNEFHSITLDRMAVEAAHEIRYLGRGHYRQVWMLSSSTNTQKQTQKQIIGSSSNNNDDDDAVLKINRYHKEISFGNYEYFLTRNEAVCMLETQSSNRTMNIYGYCGTSTLTEPGHDIIEEKILPGEHYISQEKLDRQQVDDVKPMNDLSPAEKLDIALAMAESLAELHGNARGQIISHDVGFDQWLVSSRDGLLKLNDFNKARPLSWNTERNEYCKVWSHQNDKYRAPEEVHGGWIDASADVCAYGKFVYSLLTGLGVYYSAPPPNRGKKAIKALENKELPYVDPRYRTRSYIEGRLVEIMEQCYRYNATERVDIFTVVSHLRETARIAQLDTLQKAENKTTLGS